MKQEAFQSIAGCGQSRRAWPWEGERSRVEAACVVAASVPAVVGSKANGNGRSARRRGPAVGLRRRRCTTKPRVAQRTLGFDVERLRRMPRDGFSATCREPRGRCPGLGERCSFGARAGEIGEHKRPTKAGRGGIVFSPSPVGRAKLKHVARCTCGIPIFLPSIFLPSSPFATRLPRFPATVSRSAPSSTVTTPGPPPKVAHPRWCDRATGVVRPASGNREWQKDGGQKNGGASLVAAA